MSEIRIFNLRKIGKGVLKATISVDLGTGIIIHECKIIEQNGTCKAELPQLKNRDADGKWIYQDLVELQDQTLLTTIKSKILEYYHSHVE